jgi:hypothetical protein
MSEWKCPKPECDLGVDAHNLALFLDHLHHDEPRFTGDAAQEVAGRVIAHIEDQIAETP